MSMFDKAQEVAGTIAETAKEGVEAARHAGVAVAGSVADAARTVADKTVDATKTAADALKSE
jgi:isopropylmalate/homocitrate/citramalate synthase